MDLRIVHAQDVLSVREFGPVVGQPDRLSIVGTDLDKAASVLVNRQPAASFAIVNRGQILADIPESEQGVDIADVAVLSNQFTSSARSRLVVGLGDRPQYVSGLARLVQRFLKTLLRNPGSDIYRPTSGAGLGAIITQFITSSSTVTSGDVALAVRRAERQMVGQQATSATLADDERLLSASLVGVEVTGSSTLAIRISLFSQTGQTALALLES